MVKWLVGLLLALAVAWLVVPRGEGQTGEGQTGEGEVVESSRRMLDAAWRGKPEREMAIGEMERYAAGLDDEELWVELEKVHGDWMNENEGRKKFRQPRLAVMLAREIGRRNGEVGMVEMARWLEDLEPSLEDLEQDTLEMQRQFFNTRALTASFGGWVTSEPDEAISRLIESGGKEEVWPVPNQGFFMYFKTGGFFAVERVLRDGFERLAQRDLKRAQELLVEGTASWAFDVNEVYESVFKFMTKEEQAVFFDAKVPKEAFTNMEGRDSISDFEEDLETNTYGSLFEGFVKSELWTSDTVEVRIGGDSDTGWPRDKLDLLARVKPDEGTRLFKDSRTSEDIATRLFAFLAANDPSKYELLSAISENSRQQALNLLMEGEGVLSFGPIDGKEDSWQVDYEKLKFAVSDLEIDSNQKSRLLDDIQHYQEIR
ncbi:MAG: hypothetical protein ACJAVK_002201 [Akkermansiaceae bacterium]|jgi:hypothetical protein